MGYRGHDLDLRTPQTWQDAPGDPAGAGAGLNGPSRGRGYQNDQEIPIWVDDTVLACCNHAFDVALAHRSAEVRVEHLLHALTRIEDAAEILEASGIRAASLRRETATVIAGEIPVSLTNGSSAPRRSDSFEEVLRLAAAHSYQRNAPVSVDDLLHVFLELRPAVRGLELIERHLVSRPRERPMPAFRRSPPPPPPPPPRNYVASDPRYETRERVRRPAGRFLATEGYGRESGYQPSHGPLPDSVQAATDHLQNSRIDALEEIVRTISNQIAGQRDDASRFSGSVFDRLQTLETLVTSRPETGDGNSDQVLARIDDLQGLLSGLSPQALDLGPVLERIAGLERRIGEAGSIGPISADIDLSVVETRLADLEKRLGERLMELDRTSDLGELAGRLDSIETALLGRDGEMSGDVDSRMRDLTEAVALQQSTLEDSKAALAADVRDVNASLAEQTMRITRTGESLGELVRAIESLRNEERNTVAQVAGLLSKYQSEVQQFVAQSNETHEVHNAELKEVHDALMKLNQNQHTLAGSMDQWRTDGAGDLAIIASRIEGLEQAVEKPNQLLQSMSVNLDNINRFTVERYHRRNRFWYWLFGTDDWVAASWPSQAQRIEAERAALRQAQGV